MAIRKRIPDNCVCRHSMLSRWIMAAWLAGLGASLAGGQTPSGGLAGVVHDPSGAPIAGATVSIQQTGAGAIHETATSITGTFRIGNIAPASYSLTVSKSGFRTLH